MSVWETYKPEGPSAGLAMQIDARQSAEADKRRPLTPYEQRFANTVHRLMFGQEPVENIVRDHVGAGAGQPSPQGGMAPQPAPQPSGPQTVQVPLSQGDQAQEMGATSGVSTPMLAHPDRQKPQNLGAAGAPSYSQMMGDRAFDAPAGPPSGGMRMGAIATRATSMRGPDGSAPPMPRTRADLDALMNFVHSGVPSMQERSRQAEAQRQQQLMLQQMLEQGRNTRAAAGNEVKQSVAEAGNQTKKEVADTTEAGKNARFDKQLAEMQRLHTQQHMDRLAAIQQRAEAVAARIGAASGKGGGGELTSLGKELSSLESELKTETAAAGKYSGQASNIMSTPEGRAASAKLQAEAEKRAADVKAAIAVTRAKLEDARKRAPKGGESQSSGGSISSGGAADTVTVTGPDGKPMTMTKKKGK